MLALGRSSFFHVRAGPDVLHQPLFCRCLHQITRLEKVKLYEEKQLEAQSVPVRNYLTEHVMPTLTQGLVQCCRSQPQDPVDFLVSVPSARVLHSHPLVSSADSLLSFQAEYLLKNNPFNS